MNKIYRTKEMMPVYAQGVVFAVQKNKEPEKGIPEGWSWTFAKLRADKKLEERSRM